MVRRDVGGEEEKGARNKERWPKWMKDGFTLLDACPTGEVEDWGAAVEIWVRLEEAYGFKSSISLVLPSRAGLRPAEVGQWIKYGRSMTRETQVEDQGMLKTKWWEWWTSLAPEWRDKDASGRLRIGETTGEWGSLAHPGANGILMVLLPLVWWRRAEGSERATDEWVATVRDVGWVLQGLLATAKG
ncbi:hypothetical protein B0H14DRAFT_2357400 [Mycena olivaceomarginata]|nr:hypothetical protein B0H14DRAFT_2357400 [Mycena olivaceomarginata]